MKMLRIKEHNAPYESVQRVSSQQQAQQDFSIQPAGSRALRFLFASASMETQTSLAEMEYERQLEQLITKHDKILGSKQEKMSYFDIAVKIRRLLQLTFTGFFLLKIS
jgi:hypothetical protein